MTTVRKHIFGPVASRRLGLSLGLDLVPPKTCSLDCIYCEARSTTDLTLERREYVPADEVIAELEDYLREKPELDYITFSGAGEPTLNSGIGRIVHYVRQNHPEYKLCLLTNAVSFGDPQVLADIREVDLCIPSFDASNEAEFQAINRPCPGVSFAGFTRNLIDYTRSAGCRIWLELFIVPGVNDSAESVRRFAEYIRAMKLEKVQLNTLDRPGTLDTVKVPDKSTLTRFIRALEAFVPVEAVGRFRYKSAHLRENLELDDLDREVMNYVLRRPATLDDLATACGVPPGHLRGRLEVLAKAGMLSVEKGERGVFYGTNAEFGA